MANDNKTPPSRRSQGVTDPAQKRTREAERQEAQRSTQRAPVGPDQEHDKLGEQVGVRPGSSDQDLEDLGEGIASEIDIDEDDRVTQRTEAQRDPDEDR